MYRVTFLSNAPQGCQIAFFKQKILFWVKDVGIFNGHLVYFTAILYILWPFGTFCGNCVGKLWQP
jgi:hypothetical protein